MYHLFAVTQPGLEWITRQELVALGLQNSAETAGGVTFETDLAGLYRVNLQFRTPNRVLSRLGVFGAYSFSELRKKASRLPWEEYLHHGQTLALRVTCHKSKLYHSDGVAERVAGAVEDRMGQKVRLLKADEESLEPPQLVLVRLNQDQCTISLDSSGMLLHRRGYRLATAKAPLRETLAASLLLAAGWDTTSPLLDPFCGSGTIPIEAALLARRIAPGKGRHFAFMDWPNYDSKLWKACLDQAKAAEVSTVAPILASDRDAGAIRISQENAERAGVADAIQFSCRAVSAIEAPTGPGWVVTNPPYGVRVSPTHDLRNLYAQLGHVLRSLCPGWKVGILCNSESLVGHSGLRFEQKISLVNGGIPVQYFMGQVKTGSR